MTTTAAIRPDSPGESYPGASGSGHEGPGDDRAGEGGAGEDLLRALDEKTICAVAVNLDTGSTEVIEAKSGQVSPTAPATGNWAVALPHWVFRSGVTRSANNKTGAKDSEHSLMDFLTPEAGQLFINWTFHAYKKAVGDEFGKTVLGFRGDEAAYWVIGSAPAES